MEKSTFELEKNFLENGYQFVVGTDEVGRGPLCGPVVAAAVTLKDRELRVENLISAEWDLVRDSKKLSEKQREKVFNFISENFHIGVGFCNHATIDRINILEASFLAMKKAIQELIRNLNLKTQGNKLNHQDLRCIILVDGNKKIPNLSMDQLAVVGGDKTVKSISAASIIAKVVRDRMMEQFHLKYPQYGFDKHKGYGTKDHVKAILNHGPCEIHRKTFSPINRLANLKKG